MNDRCAAARLSLGAYTLGTLEPADQQLVEAHLASCPDCLTELPELESVVPALARLSADDVSPPSPSADLFTRIAGAVDASDTSESESAGPESKPADLSAKRRLRSKCWLVAVATSVVVLAGGGTAIGIAVSSSSSQPATTVATGTAGGVYLRVAATDAKSGTRLELTSNGLPSHEHCRLVALAADGSRHDAGSWDASYAGRAEVTESTDVPRSELRRLTLYGNDGHLLVVVNL